MTRTIETLTVTVESPIGNRPLLGQLLAVAGVRCD